MLCRTSCTASKAPGGRHRAEEVRSAGRIEGRRLRRPPGDAGHDRPDASTDSAPRPGYLALSADTTATTPHRRPARALHTAATSQHPASGRRARPAPAGNRRSFGTQQQSLQLNDAGPDIRRFAGHDALPVPEARLARFPRSSALGRTASASEIDALKGTTSSMPPRGRPALAGPPGPRWRTGPGQSTQQIRPWFLPACSRGMIPAVRVIAWLRTGRSQA